MRLGFSSTAPADLLAGATLLPVAVRRSLRSAAAGARPVSGRPMAARRPATAYPLALTRPPWSTEPAFRHLPRATPGAAAVRYSRPASSRSPCPHIPTTEHRPSIRSSPSHGPCTNVPSTSGFTLH